MFEKQVMELKYLSNPEKNKKTRDLFAVHYGNCKIDGLRSEFAPLKWILNEILRTENGNPTEPQMNSILSLLKSISIENLPMQSTG